MRDLEWKETRSGHEEIHPEGGSKQMSPGRQLRWVFCQDWETWQGRARASCEVTTLKRKVNSTPEVNGQTSMTIEQQHDAP